MTRIQRSDVYAFVNGDNRAGVLYNRVMVFVILFCLVPLTSKESNPVFNVVEYICVTVFIVDYLMRWATADFKLGRGAVSFFMYPFTPMAIVDLLTILPTFAPVSPVLRVLRVCRLLQSIQSFKFTRYGKGLRIVSAAFSKQARPLLLVLAFIMLYVNLCAIVMINIEPDAFNTFLDAQYWATISITTIGYGDYVPTTEIGRMVTMLSSVVGIAVIALPSGIITAAVLEELRLEGEIDDRQGSDGANG